MKNKKILPYAIAVVVIAIILLVVGAIFLRQFWCRYLCPLGAISSAFKYFYVFIVFTVILLVLKQAEIEIGLVWILGSLALIAYVLELIGLRVSQCWLLLPLGWLP